jgi:hypothetical protein
MAAVKANVDSPDLEKEKFNWFKNQVELQNGMNAYWAMQEKDFAYVKLTVALVLLIVVLYYLSCHFGFHKAAPAVAAAEAAATVPTMTEKFSPYVSTLAHDERRSDAAGDVSSANPPPTRPEAALFDQLDGWAIITPLKITSNGTPVNPSKYSDPVS